MSRIAKVIAALGLACIAAGARAEAASLLVDMPTAPYGIAAPHPSLYAFADVFRLTVRGAPLAGPLAEPPAAYTVPIQALADMPVRVARGEPQLAGYTFTVASVPTPEGWLLLLSGLAAAGWVARRRLMNAY